MTVGEFKAHLIGMSHSGTLNKVRNFEEALERAINTVIMKLDPIETERRIPLVSPIYSKVYNYALPSDYKRVIDIYPQDNRNSRDRALSDFIEYFAAEANIRNRRLSIESQNGVKYIRLNWKNIQPLAFGSMDSPTADGGTWTAVGTASAPIVDQLVHVVGTASLRFNIAASGDGLQNIGINEFDLEDWVQESMFFAYVYIPDSTSLSKITGINAAFGNDLTTNFWTLPEQTGQFDGTAFQVGWNLLGFPWSAAVETGTVDATALKAFQMTFQCTGAVSNLRIDNISAGLGRMFEIKYYSKFVIVDSAGNWNALTGSDDDDIILDQDSINILLLETLKNVAQQMEGEDSTFDLNYANKELHGDPQAVDVSGRVGLYAMYRKAYPSQSKKPIAHWSSGPRFRR